MTYSKPYLTYAQQVTHLETRGLSIPDQLSAIATLRAVGYYNFSGYLYSYRIPHPSGQGRSNQIAPGTTFPHVVALMQFDHQLRDSLLSGIQQIEISLRAQIAHTLGAHDPFGYVNPASLDPNAILKQQTRNGITHSAFDWFGIEYQRLERRVSNEVYVRHNLDKYGPPLPIWVACEFLDFGASVNLYQLLTYEDRATIAAEAGLKQERTLRSWLTTLNYVRNICAHNARVWNRSLIQRIALRPSDLPLELKPLATAPQNKIYPVCAMTAYLLSNLNPDTEWGRTIAETLHAFPISSHRSMSEMGAPTTWASEPIWNRITLPEKGTP